MMCGIRELASLSSPCLAPLLFEAFHAGLNEFTRFIRTCFVRRLEFAISKFVVGGKKLLDLRSEVGAQAGKLLGAIMRLRMRGECNEPVVARPGLTFFFLLSLDGSDQPRPYDAALAQTYMMARADGISRPRAVTEMWQVPARITSLA
jgi:hypothetical protein